ncbi:hypothetical protein C8T65DRAFT_661632 [Cerioporus squamosus]|nr:hypothetical protein C8T65DRAFT_661632 [Cerioporus squamosus]
MPPRNPTCDARSAPCTGLNATMSTMRTVLPTTLTQISSTHAKVAHLTAATLRCLKRESGQWRMC